MISAREIPRPHARCVVGRRLSPTTEIWKVVYGTKRVAFFYRSQTAWAFAHEHFSAQDPVKVPKPKGRVHINP